jgi:hypothetical protein
VPGRNNDRGPRDDIARVAPFSDPASSLNLREARTIQVDVRLIAATNRTSRRLSRPAGSVLIFTKRATQSSPATNCSNAIGVVASPGWSSAEA